MDESSNTDNFQSLSESELIKKITKSFKNKKKSTILDIGDDSAIIKFEKSNIAISQDILVEGVHFDLSYVPLKHLGYKSVVVNVSDIISMSIKPSHILVSIAVSNRFKVDALEELYEGIKLACKFYDVDLIGGDTTSSNKGLMISVTCIGNKENDKITKRTGAKEGDLLVVSGDLGSAYMGLQVLEREKKVFEVNPNSQPDLSNYTYCIERQLKPEARIDIINHLEELKINPTSMIDISDGLSTEINHLSNSSGVSFHIYEEKIPIADETKKICNEFKINPSIAALNGGEDYELLLTVDKRHEKKIESSNYLTIIGSSLSKKNDNCMITSIGQKININSSGWDSFKS
jgi:thiamine-monophosphate kinase